MPVDKSKYPENWDTVICPDILARADNKCEFCGIKNHITVIRGYLGKLDVYQDENDGSIYLASNSQKISEGPLGEVGYFKPVKIVLTIMHLDHNTNNNDYLNLKAGCQRCHNRWDNVHRRTNAAITRLKKRGATLLDLS